MTRSGHGHVDARPTNGSTLKLRLYIYGQGGRNAAAEQRLREICQEITGGDFEIEVVDVQAQPRVAADEGLLALPAVDRVQPGPPIRVLGDLSDRERVRAILFDGGPWNGDATPV